MSGTYSSIVLQCILFLNVPLLFDSLASFSCFILHIINKLTVMRCTNINVWAHPTNGINVRSRERVQNSEF